jgi:hypothetical protein
MIPPKMPNGARIGPGIPHVPDIGIYNLIIWIESCQTSLWISGEGKYSGSYQQERSGAGLKWTANTCDGVCKNNGK